MRTLRRWLSEHRRLLALVGVTGALAAGGIATLVGGSSAAQRRVALSGVAMLGTTRADLRVAQAQITQLRTLSATQSAQVTALRAQLRALRHHDQHMKRRR